MTQKDEALPTEPPVSHARHDMDDRSLPPPLLSKKNKQVRNISDYIKSVPDSRIDLGRNTSVNRLHLCKELDNLLSDKALGGWRQEPNETDYSVVDSTARTNPAC